VCIALLGVKLVTESCSDAQRLNSHPPFLDCIQCVKCNIQCEETTLCRRSAVYKNWLTDLDRYNAKDEVPFQYETFMVAFHNLTDILNLLILFKNSVNL